MNLDTIGEKIDDIEVSISHRIIELFSAGLYSSPNKAFEELVCNSYDAFASKVAVYVPSDSTVEGAYIWVCDNGEGLNPKELKNLWRIGESTKRQGNVRDKKRLQIGQFGIGKLQMQGNPVRTVSGSEHQSQTTAKGHYFMTFMRLRSYLVNPTKV